MDEQRRIEYLENLRRKKPYGSKDIYYKGIKQKLNVYQIDLDYLVYNHLNGRIASYVKSYTKETGIEISPNTPEGIDLIQKFIKESNPNANESTYKSIKEQGQNEYGIVTRDGVVIDGNRRSMILREIAKEKNESPAYFLGVILDETLNEGGSREIMRLETTYQMGEDAKVDYNAIEKYLKSKDLIDNDFTEKEIAKMMGVTESDVKEYISIMDLMDDYLDKLNYSGIYTRLDKTEGAFVDLNNYLNRYKNPNKSSMVQWNYDKERDVNDLKLIYFDYIRWNYNKSKDENSDSGDSKEYRFIGQTSKKGSFFSNENVWKKFRDYHFENIDTIINNEPSIDEDRENNPEKSLSEVLKERDKRWAKKANPVLRKNFGIARENLNNLNKQNEPYELLLSAKYKLEAINPDSKSFLQDEKVFNLIRDINKLTYEYTEIIKKNKKR